MMAPQWLGSTGAAMAIALSSLPMIAVVPSVVDAHQSLDRELAHEYTAAATELTAAVTVATIATRPHASAND